MDPQGVPPPPKEHVGLLKLRLGKILLGQDSLSLSDRMVGFCPKASDRNHGSGGKVPKKSKIDTLQETSISPKNGILRMIFLFPRWDMLIPWRVPPAAPHVKTLQKKLTYFFSKMVVGRLLSLLGFGLFCFTDMLVLWRVSQNSYWKGVTFFQKKKVKSFTRSRNTQMRLVIFAEFHLKVHTFDIELTYFGG